MTTVFKAGFGCWQPRMLHGRPFLRCDEGIRWLEWMFRGFSSFVTNLLGRSICRRQLMKYFVRINSEYLSNDTFRAFGRGGLRLHIRTNLSNSGFDNIAFIISFIFVHRYRVGGLC